MPSRTKTLTRTTPIRLVAASSGDRDEGDDYEVARSRSGKQDDDADDDEPEEEERPRRKKRKKKKAGSKMALWVSLGVVGTLAIMSGTYFAVAFAIGIWPFGGVGEGMKFMPDNCRLLVSVKYDELEKSQVYQDLKAANPRFAQIGGVKGQKEFDFYRKKGIISALIGVAAKDGGTLGTLGKTTPDTCVVLQLKESITSKELIENATAGGDLEEQKIGSYSMFYNSDGRLFDSCRQDASIRRKGRG